MIKGDPAMRTRLTILALLLALTALPASADTATKLDCSADRGLTFGDFKGG